MKKVAILGSTGSIGTQTLDVIRRYKNDFQVVSLVAYSNGTLLIEQAKEFNVKYYSLIKDNANALMEAVSFPIDLVVVATRGIIALNAVIYCIEHDIDVALANKETLVCGGKLVYQALESSKSKVLPVDSEHSAIFQCLMSGNTKEVNKLILTASGGAFWDYNLDQLNNVDYFDALKHPNWNMGSKITIDSATMFNKTLEVLEAKWLFNVSKKQIEILVHPESIVHSLVEFCDGSVVAQIAKPDMRLPISYALFYPERANSNFETINLINKNLRFYEPDLIRFPCVNLAYELNEELPLLPTVMCAANDVCVESFSSGRIKFNDFYKIIKKVCNIFEKEIDNQISVERIYHIDAISRQKTMEIIGENEYK